MKNYKALFLLAFFAPLLTSSCGEKSVVDAPKTDNSIQHTSKTPKTETPKLAEASSNTAPKPDRGQMLYKRCATCHTLKPGARNKVGPNLNGVFGANAGSKEGFNYSVTMKASGLVWTDENLAAYIENPGKFMPGNRMSFVGIRKAEDIDAVLAYMKKEMAKE